MLLGSELLEQVTVGPWAISSFDLSSGSSRKSAGKQAVFGYLISFLGEDAQTNAIFGLESFENVGQCIFGQNPACAEDFVSHYGLLQLFNVRQ